MSVCDRCVFCFIFQAEDGIRDLVRSRGLGDVYKRQGVAGRQVPVLAAVGAGDLAANALFGMASSMGMVSVAAVLGSLYPVMTILLARYFLNERLRRIQVIGSTLALCGCLLYTSDAADERSSVDFGGRRII